MFSNHLDAIPLQDNDRRVEVVICEGAPKEPEYYKALYFLLDDDEFINSLGLWFRARDLSNFNPGEVAQRGADRGRVLETLKSDDRKVIEHLIETWPADLISNATLAAQLNGASSGPLSPRLSKAQVGIAKHAGLVEVKPIFMNGSTIRLKCLRNHEKWTSTATTPERVRVELDKAVFRSGG